MDADWIRTEHLATDQAWRAASLGGPGVMPALRLSRPRRAAVDHEHSQRRGGSHDDMRATNQDRETI